MPTPSRFYSPAAAEKLRCALLSLAAAATATVAAARENEPQPLVAGAPLPPPRTEPSEPEHVVMGLPPPFDPKSDSVAPPPSDQTFAQDGTHAFLKRVDAGETLSAIAVRHGVPLQRIVELNDLSDPDRIREGDLLWIPYPDAVGTPDDKGHLEPKIAGKLAYLPRQDVPTPSAPSLPPKEGFTVYVIRLFDTLSAIAQQHQVSMKSIVEANGIADPNYIQVGQQLYVPTQKDPRYTQRTGGVFVSPPGTTNAPPEDVMVPNAVPPAP